MKFERIPGVWNLIVSTVYLLGLAVMVFVAPSDFVVGFAAGGALVVLNGWMSSRNARRADLFNRGSALATLLGGFYVRLAMLAVCLYFLISSLKVNPVGLVTGLSVVPAGLLVMLGLIYIANRRPKEV